MITRVLIIFVITASTYSENKFMTAVRNITVSDHNNSNGNQTKRQSSEDNPLIDEISKYTMECKSDGFSFQSDQGSDNQGYSERDGGSSRTYPDYHGDRSSYPRNRNDSKGRNENDDNKDIDTYLTGYGNNYNSQKQRNSYSDEKNKYDSGGNPDDDSYNRQNIDNRNYNTKGNENYNGRTNGDGRLGDTFAMTYAQGSGNDKNNPYNTNNYNYPSNGNDQSYNTNPYNNYRSSDYGGYNNNGREPYSTSVDSVRWKRSSEHCVSQCIFGYIELLDENNLPSETATIKFLQDHMHNDRNRLKLIRDTRRCFAKLATTENEDGCEFSKSLAKCLKLNIE